MENFSRKRAKHRFKKRKKEIAFKKKNRRKENIKKPQVQGEKVKQKNG